MTAADGSIDCCHSDYIFAEQSHDRYSCTEAVMQSVPQVCTRRLTYHTKDAAVEFTIVSVYSGR